MVQLNIQKDLQKLADPQRAKDLSWFFKTGKGDYGEGDVFWGVTSVPIKKLAQKYFKQASLNDIQRLLNSKVHEQRMLALQILLLQFKKGDDKTKTVIYNFYLKNTKNINNWDLVDVSTPKIIGAYLVDKNKKILYKLAKSKSLWERRVAVLATFSFIKIKKYSDAIKIAEILLNDTHDLIHKAVGWMLREVGKKDIATEEKFLKKHYKKMPRTMLRYAIEKFPKKRRQSYLKEKI